MYIIGSLDVGLSSSTTSSSPATMSLNPLRLLNQEALSFLLLRKDALQSYGYDLRENKEMKYFFVVDDGCISDPEEKTS